jgi:predicted dienelactone hydrolase
MGMTRLDGLKGDAEVIVYYPTAAADQATQRGPFTIAMAPEAPPERGNGRVVVISHGSAGNAWVHSDLARDLVRAGFVVVLPHHRGDHAMDDASPGPESWKLRTAEVSRAIDAVGKDARFAPLLSLDKVGVFGQSAGGHTALTLAGGRWSPGLFKKHCDAHIAEDFNACVGSFTLLNGGWLDGVKKTTALGVLRQRYDDDTLVAYTDPRIVAAVAGVPAAADFDYASLAHPKIALGLVTAGRDPWLAPRFHSERVLAACRPRCELVASVPQGGHSILLGPMPPMDVLGKVERQLLADPPGFDRKDLPEVDRKIVAFFQKHLK